MKARNLNVPEYPVLSCFVPPAVTSFLFNPPWLSTCTGGLVRLHLLARRVRRVEQRHELVQHVLALRLGVRRGLLLVATAAGGGGHGFLEREGRPDGLGRLGERRVDGVPDGAAGALGQSNWQLF